MAHIPESVLKQCLLIEGLDLVGRGKVRDRYDLPGHPDKLFFQATDRVSAFDIVLPTTIPQKGAVLTAMHHFWLTHVMKGFFETDFVAAGAGIDEFLPEGLRQRPDLQKTGLVVERRQSPQFESIVRNHLTGSGFKDYTKTGIVCGHRLPPGLIDGSRLPTPIFTPSTKADAGHDLNVSVYDVLKILGPEHEHRVLMLAGMLTDYARRRGIILADMKVEEFADRLIDEIGTPDACRYWDAREWEAAHAKGKLPRSLDKQFIREECKRLGIDKLDPENAEHLALVAGMEFGYSVRMQTTRLYRYIFWRLAGKMLERYQSEDLGIKAEIPRRRVEVVVGSESDLPQIKAGVIALRGEADGAVSVLSCHRNEEELGAHCRDRLSKADVVIACAGKAAQLPGWVKTRLCTLGHPEIPVLGVAMKGKTIESDLEAINAIKGLPENPVELSSDGTPYFGVDGFIAACTSALDDEFLPKAATSKPAQIDVMAL